MSNPKPDAILMTSPSFNIFMQAVTWTVATLLITINGYLTKLHQRRHLSVKSDVENVYSKVIMQRSAAAFQLQMLLLLPTCDVGSLLDVGNKGSGRHLGVANLKIVELITALWHELILDSY
jgi:hypothetical protein